ncbi:hypothetical protein GOARA_050_00150 [Gordonia araii NBRC 100433]|uniref:PE domain-containing protein n=1 Tax=Gordonia araii NBRC 100433 TaxID=1073574 RepID=G7H278_9ACTN|nr:hypothetical protein [Gordonia araii]NNG97492.1 hypothetical protein [Gordonia araii NBRC 100433]GAB09953.1 hypothetical protein GOARA_050_00150 [Gordonia araii NBRC 100433]
MSSVTVFGGALEGLAATSGAMGTALATGGGVNAAANTAAMAAVFGVIGQEFVAAFVAAQAAHLAAVGNIAAVHAGTAASLLAGSVEFSAADAAGAAMVR